MATSADEFGPVARSPDDVFAAIADETRVRIIQALGQAGGPLPFSDLRERVGMGHSGQFHYHLDRLVGHVVTKVDDAYVLSEAGKRIVEAIHAGVLEEHPPSERLPVDIPCWECGGAMEVQIGPGWIEAFCTECAGVYPGTGDEPDGRLVRARLPPAGLLDRSPAEAWRVGVVLSRLDMLAYANGICPRCSAPVSHTLDVCGDHLADDRPCAACDRMWAVMVDTTCTNCIFEVRTSIANILGGHEATLRFWLNRGWNLTDPAADTDPSWGWAEEVRSVEPFAGRFTWRLQGDELVLEVDDSLNVEVVR